MTRVYHIDDKGFAFAKRDFTDKRMAEAYVRGMKDKFPDHTMRIEDAQSP